MLIFYFGQAISQNNSKPLIVRVLFAYYVNMIIVFKELCKSNCRNVIREILQLFPEQW